MTLALAGCGGGSGTNRADDYAKKICDQFQPQRKKIEAANDSITSVSTGDHKPNDVKSTDSAAFQQLSGAYKALADAVRNAGAPPVDNGAQIQQNAAKRFDDASSSYAGLKKTVDGLDTSDQGKFADGLTKVAAKLSTLARSSDDALNKLQSGDVGKAMNKQPGCSRPTSSPTISPSAAASRAASTAPSASKGATTSPSVSKSAVAKNG
nr:small secreted protein [Streptomyces sp. SID5468]